MFFQPDAKQSSVRINFLQFALIRDRQAESALHCAQLLRLSVLLHRSHAREEIPLGRLAAIDGGLSLALPAGWLAAHPLTQADLATEAESLREGGRRLEIATH